jgi:hypothetical protein
MASKTYHLRPIDDLGRAAMLWLGINIGSEALGLALSIADLALLFNTDRLDDAQFNLWDQMVVGSNVLLLPWYICLVVVGMWIYRASANAHAVGKGLQVSPPWAVGWFVIPFANLWKPYESMSETWRISHDPTGWRRHRSPGAMKIWWAGWLIATISGNIGSRIVQGSADRGVVAFASGLLMISAVAGIVASWTLRGLIRGVTERQTDLLRAQVF